MIPALKTIIDKSSEMGIENVILGMPHRCTPQPYPTLSRPRGLKWKGRDGQESTGCWQDLGVRGKQFRKFEESLGLARLSQKEPCSWARATWSQD